MHRSLDYAQPGSAQYQREVTRICINCALMLLQHGAETMLVEQLSSRLGLALGMSSVEMSISANAIVLTTLTPQGCLTTTRRNLERGINMYMVTEVQHIVIMAEHQLVDAQDVDWRLSHIKPRRYPTWLVVLMVALSCGCFSMLNGAGPEGFLVTFIASGIAMFVRVQLSKRHLNHFITFGLTAFVATSISGSLLQIPALNTSDVAMAASVLLLVPGFPLINAVADMFKGHVNTGLARWATASLLTLWTCMGIVMALSIWGIKGWL